MDYTSLSIDSFVLLSQPSLLGCSVSLLLSLIYYRVVYLSTYFFKYFSLFLIFLLYFHIFTIFDIFLYIICIFSVFFLKKWERAKGAPLPGVRVTGHAPSVKSPEGLLTDDGCRRNKPKKEPVWLASYQTGSFLVLIRLVTRQTGYYTGSHRIRLVPGGFHGCPVR